MSKFSNVSLLASDERVTDDQLAEEVKLLSFTRAANRLSRRNFVTSAVAGAAGLAGAAALAGCSSTGTIAETVTTPSVFDVLNFALNLEYLEASFYLYVATGNGLSAADLGGTGFGPAPGFAKVNFVNPSVAQTAQNLATDEQEHVEQLRAAITALGGTPVPCPALNLTAMGAVTNDATFLALARALETVGISAYAGGAQYLTSNATALLYAAQILDTEAQHEGNLRQQCIQYGVTSPAVDSMDSPPTASKIFNTSATTGLNPVRTTSQVLQIVYGAAGVTGVSSGGFFPQGLNGLIRTS